MLKILNIIGEEKMIGLLLNYIEEELLDRFGVYIIFLI